MVPSCSKRNGSHGCIYVCMENVCVWHLLYNTGNHNAVVAVIGFYYWNNKSRRSIIVGILLLHLNAELMNVFEFIFSPPLRLLDIKQTPLCINIQSHLSHARDARSSNIVLRHSACAFP